MSSQNPPEGLLPSTASAAGTGPALFGDFVGTTSPSDFSGSCIVGLRLMAFPTWRCAQSRRAARRSPGSRAERGSVRARVFDRAGPLVSSRFSATSVLPSLRLTASAPWRAYVAAQYQPAPALSNASPPSSRMAALSEPKGPLSPYRGINKMLPANEVVHRQDRRIVRLTHARLCAAYPRAMRQPSRTRAKRLWCGRAKGPRMAESIELRSK